MKIRTQCGFTLLEVLVALIVIAVGLLGIAGIQALAINSTSVARVQSLAAIEASSLAGAMQANSAYWSASPPLNTTITNQTLSQTQDCSVGACTAAQMAAYDLNQWTTSLSNLLPQGGGSVTCTSSANIPITCTINVTWLEKTVAVNSSAASVGVSNLSATQSYSMVVQP